MLQKNRRPPLIPFSLEKALRRRKTRFSPVFYDLHRARLEGRLRAQFGCLYIVALIATPVCLPLWFGHGSVLAASCIGALFVCILINTVFSTRDEFQARVLPYFERKLGGTDTWLAGRALLWNSRALDEIARDLQVTPLSEFASGDPLILGETPRMFDAGAALATVEALLGDATTGLLGAEVLSDLTKLRAALALARENEVRFSLHLREGSTVSGQEMDARKGSYF